MNWFLLGLLRLSAAIDTLNEKIGKGVAWLVLLTCIICAGNAVIRKLFNDSSNAYLEIQWYLFSAIFLLGAGYTLKANEHIRIDILSSKLGVRAQLWIDIAGLLLFLTPLSMLVIYVGIPFFLDSMMRGEVSADAGGLVRWPAKLLIVVGFALLQLQGLSELIKRFAQLRQATPTLPTSGGTAGHAGTASANS